MKISLILVTVVLALVGGVRSEETASSVYESSVVPVPTSRLDKIVFAKLARLGIQPVLCSDAVFVRRAYLDVTGTLPTAEEAREFIEDPKTKDKRTALIDRLMQRDEFADYWTLRWGDILRIKAEFPVNLWPNAAQAYSRWIRESIASNKPYDVFARELLTSSGSNFRVGPVNFYRAIQNRTPEGIATAVALTLMGARTESWPSDRLADMTVFFSEIGYKPTREWKEECVFWDPFKLTEALQEEKKAKEAKAKADEAKAKKNKKSKKGKKVTDTEADEVARPLPRVRTKTLVGVFPDGTKVSLPPDKDPREVFADWLITPDNPWFTRSIANRIWAWVMGRGIIVEPDDIRDNNPPCNPVLLAYLEKELRTSHYDLHRFYRMLLTSKTYQFSSIPHSESPEAKANFASYPVRRLDAEVLIDAINKITGTTDLYTSAIPEPFTYIPKDQPAIALADGSITSSFLTLFGRSARATGMANERNNEIDSAQWLHMLNSSHIQQKLERGPKLRAILTARRKISETVEQLYLTILSRFPTDDEVKDAEQFLNKKGRSRYYAWIDLSWALINSPEFLFRH